MTDEEQIRTDEEKKIDHVYCLLMDKNTNYDNDNMEELDKYEDFYKRMAVMKGIIMSKTKLYFRRQKEAFARIKKTYKELLDKRIKEILYKSGQ